MLLRQSTGRQYRTISETPLNPRDPEAWADVTGRSRAGSGNLQPQASADTARHEGTSTSSSAVLLLRATPSRPSLMQTPDGDPSPFFSVLSAVICNNSH
ncbi:hypothetical protein VTN00DRAFT_7198 [Thermoascus crustaceus]|uniref:uncharacterized protein n=1 Tax=Thermoascus crustaceus TaxID=5088 RepID=UPI0037433B52